MEPYAGYPEDVRNYKLRKYCLRVPNVTKELWQFKKGGLPHIRDEALRIIEMCEALGVPVSPNANAAFFHEIIMRLVKMEKALRPILRDSDPDEMEEHVG